MKTASLPAVPSPANDPGEPGGVRFLGLMFHPMTVEEAAGKLAREASVDTAFSYVATPNVDHIVRLEKDPSLRPLYDHAGLILNDSRILELLARRDGHVFPASPGADLVEFLFRQEIQPDDPIVIIGCTGEDVKVVQEHFDLNSVCWHEAPMGLKNNPEAVAACAKFMADHPARFHFICVGSPQQEMVACAAVKRGDVKGIGICCGASLDFLSGKTHRAPVWMRRHRLEWLHRLLSEPRRLAKRYLLDGPAILRIWHKHRSS